MSLVFVKKLIPALIGAGISLFFIKSGVLTFFFLVPFSFLAFRYNYKIFWLSILFGIIGNLLLAFWAAAINGIPLMENTLDFLYFFFMALFFALIISPPSIISARVPGIKRFIIGASFGALLLMLFYFRLMNTPGFLDYFTSLFDSLLSTNRLNGSNVVENALLESITAETVLGFINMVMLRGGALISSMFLYFVSFEAGFLLSRIPFGRRGKIPQKRSLFIAFHVSPQIIWVLSFSLLFIVLTRMAKFEIPEILLWNILVLCIILYLTQGIGILQFFLAKSTIPFFLRFLLSIMFIIMIFSPVINVVLLAAVILLGIAENWAPLRVSKKDGPPSTPEAGDNG